MSWTHANLETQGYRLSGDEALALRIGLRFPTALCLALVVMFLALESALVIALLVPIGAIAGWTPRHPFDLIGNHGLRHLAGAPELPPNPLPHGCLRAGHGNELPPLDAARAARQPAGVQTDHVYLATEVMHA